MNNFLNSLEAQSNTKYTENGMRALKSTTNSLLDMFATIGAYRSRSDADITRSFSNAFSEDNLLAWKMAFYARNVRGGLGERHVFRTILTWMAERYPETVLRNLENIPYYGRWDDLYALVGTPVEKQMFDFMKNQLYEDFRNMKKGMKVSLLAKWLKSANTSSAESRRLAYKTIEAFGATARDYRKIVVGLRKYIDVAEQKMSAGEWEAIEYSKVPSNAMTKYRKAFARHDETGFSKYMEKVEKGEAKINATTLFPYDITYKILYSRENNRVLEAQWNALPNYVEGEHNILIMADTSGSMQGRPMATSLGLACYFAERNTGIFHNKFMTFSMNPELVTIKGETLEQRLHSFKPIVANTDIAKAMDMILRAAVDAKIEQAEMPTALIIISDMEFDYCAGVKTTFYDYYSQKFADAGYEMPRIVFWNVDARQDTFHAQPVNGVQFASGQSASTFKSIIENANCTAFELMVNTLNDEMYDRIVL